MTNLTDEPTAIATYIHGAPRLLAGTTGDRRVDHTLHLSLHGDPVLRRRSWLTDALRGARLLGRGGAAFPVATKLEAVPSSATTQVLVNGSESEPASFKDRTLMTSVPHLVLDGALVVAHALGTHHVTVVVHDSDAVDSLQRAIRERSDASGVRVVHTHGGFVGGEIRAAISGLNGAIARPPGRRVLPHVAGIAGRPTFASNVETFAQIALLARLGPVDFMRTGSNAEPGTVLLTMLGDVRQPGVVEVPLGIPIATLLPREPGPVLLGGYHGSWVRDVDGLPLERGALAAVGATLGAGVIVRPPTGTCPVEDVVRVARWLADQSTGQCGPCFFGLPASADDLESLAHGGGLERLTALRRRLGLVTGRGACAHPDGAARFVGSALDAMAENFQAHAIHGDCGRAHSHVLPIPGAAS